MSKHPATPAPLPGEGAVPPPPPPPPVVDEVAAAKARLLEACETKTVDPAAKINDFLRDHPYLAASAALGAGLLVARVAVLRKLVTVGGMWLGKRYLTQYLRHMGR